MERRGMTPALGSFNVQQIHLPEKRCQRWIAGHDDITQILRDMHKTNSLSHDGYRFSMKLNYSVLYSS